MEQVMEAAEKRGRPRVERDPDERVPMSLRLRGELFNRLSEMARANNRPLGLECEYRLQRSFDEHDPPYKNLRRAMTLDLIYEREGVFGLVRHLINTEGNPDENERVLRAASARNATLPPRYEWLQPDLDDEGQPIPATRRFK
jgi:hypothetical protein